MTDELKPCPFCGGDAERITLSDDEYGNAGGDVIQCRQCLASSRVEFGFKENLVSAWNTRATPPDHLALVAAAYRDAEDKARYDYREWDNATPIECDATACEYVADAILARTPADAEAHLTALLRAEYERGVRAAADKCNALRDHEDTTDEEARGAMYCASDILALLTQEGR